MTGGIESEAEVAEPEQVRRGMEEGGSGGMARMGTGAAMEGIYGERRGVDGVGEVSGFRQPSVVLLQAA